MALIPCPDCGTEISDQAPACPKCGRPKAVAAPPKREPAKTGVGTILFVIAVAIVWFVVKMADMGGAESRAPAARSQDAAAAQALRAIKREPKVVDARWSQRISFWALVADDGSRRDGYAKYLCQVIRDNGVTGFVAVSVWASGDGYGGRKIGSSDCR